VLRESFALGSDLFLQAFESLFVFGVYEPK
jgi:hypothetical protein